MDKTTRQEYFRTLFTLILLIAFLGQVEVRPFSLQFRFSLCVPALAFILLYFPAASPILYSVIAGTVMVALRGIIAAASSEGITAAYFCAQYAPVMLFYVAYGCLFSLLSIQARPKRGVPLFFSLLVCEVVANLAELFLMHLFLVQPLETGVFFVVLIGVMRSSATAAVYRLTVYWQKRQYRKLHEERYRRLLLFFSNIKTDLLFFHKSMDDIEFAMKCSYSLYEKLKGSELGEEALSASRRIHEIKKEYQRIIASMEKALSREYTAQPMGLAEIFTVLRGNTQTLLATQKIPITVSCKCGVVWEIERYHTIISIINNLVINAVEAMVENPKGGRIDMTAKWDGEDCILSVADNGPGIPADIMECIFDPGFSTKFDPKTGTMSTGIGLTHVKSLVESYFAGKIIVTSGAEGTDFRIRIPGARNRGGKGV